MPTIVIASPKGGAGKTTAAVILATEFARAGASVTLLDCDPNHSATLWWSKGIRPSGIEVLSDVTDSTVVRTIKEHDRDGGVVICDLEGIASRFVSRAISQADLVLTPMRATTLDATIGIRTAALVQEEEEALDRPIRHAVFFTMTRAVRSRQHLGIEQSLAGQGITIVNPPLMERAAYSALFQFGGDLRSMPAQGAMENARENARLFAEAIFAQLVSTRETDNGQ